MLRTRLLAHHPWHSPPHRESDGGRYLLTAACFEHRPVIGRDPSRMASFEDQLLHTCRSLSGHVFAWVVLPNHYHVLLQTADVFALLHEIGRLHGRTSHVWNGEQNCRGRQVWCKAAETAMKSDRHYWATLNYVHHNPVKHGYVSRWQDWPYSSAVSYLEAMGRAEAERVWAEYPTLGYGDGWDVFEAADDVVA